MQNFLVFLGKLPRYAAFGSTCLMMFLVTADAMGRYFFNGGIFGAYEITEQYLMIIAVFLGMSYVYTGNAFIRVTFFIERIPPRLRLPIEYFNHFFSIGLVLFFIAASLKKAHRMFVTGAAMDFQGIPLWPAYSIMPVGLLFLALALLIDIPKIKKGESGFMKATGDSPETQV